MTKRTLMPREGGTLPLAKITRVISPPANAPKRILAEFQRQQDWAKRPPKNRHERRAAIAMCPADIRARIKAQGFSHGLEHRLLTNPGIREGLEQAAKRFAKLSPEERRAYLEKMDEEDMAG